MARKALKIAAAWLGGLAAAAATLPFWMPTGWLRARAAREASRALGTEVSIGALSLFWTGAAVEDVRVADPTGSPEPLLLLRSARASVALLPLLAGRVEGLDVRLDGLAAVFAQGADGVWNVQRLAPAAGGDTEPPAAERRGAARIPVAGAVVLNDASVRITPAGGEAVSVDALSADFRLNRGSAPLEGTVSLSIPAVWGGGALSADVRSDLSTATVALRAAGSGLRLAGEAAVEGLLPPAALRARFEGTVAGDFAAVPLLASMGLSGRFSRRLSVSYGPDGISLSQEGTLDDLAFARLDLPAVSIRDNAALEARLDGAASVDLKALAIRCVPPGIEISGTGSIQGIAPGAPAGEGGAALRLPERVALAIRARNVVGGAPSFADDRLALRSFEAAIDVEGGRGGLASDGRAEASGLCLRGVRSDEAFEVPSLTYAHRARFDPDASVLTVERLLFKTDFFSLEVRDGHFASPARAGGFPGPVRATVSLRADAGRLTSLGEAVLPAPLPAGLSGNLSAALNLEESGAVGEPLAFEATVSLADGALRLGDGRVLPLGNPAVDFAGMCDPSRRAGTLRSFSVKTYGVSMSGGPFRFGGAAPADVAFDGAFLRAAFADLATTSRVLAGAVSWPAGLAIEGQAAVSLESLQGTLREGSGTLRVACPGGGAAARGGPLPFPVAEKGVLLAGPVAWSASGREIRAEALELGGETLKGTLREAVVAAPAGARGTAVAFRVSAPEIIVDLGARSVRAALAAAPDWAASGAARLRDLHVAGSDGRLSCAGTLDLADAALRRGPEAAPLVAKAAGVPLALSWSASEGASGRWTVERLDVATPAGMVSARGEAALPAGGPPGTALSGNVSVDADAIDLAALGAFVPPLGAMAPFGIVALRGSARLAEGEPSADLTATFKGARLAPAGAAPVTVDGVCRYALAAGGADRLEVPALVVEAMGERGEVSADLSGLLAAARALGPAPNGAPRSLAPALSALRGTVRARLPAWAFQNNAVKDIALLVTTTGEAVELSALSARVNGGTVEAQGVFRAEGEHRLAATVRKADLDLASADLLSYPLPIVPRAGGRLRCTADFSVELLARGLSTEEILASLRTPAVQTVTLVDGVIEGSALLAGLSEAVGDAALAALRFWRLSADFEIRDRVVTVHRARLDGDLALEMSGTTAFDGAYDHRIKILGPPAEGDSVAARMIRAANEAGGIRVRGNLLAGGRPSIDLDKAAFARRLAEEELTRRLEKKAEEELSGRVGDLLQDLFKRRR